MFVSKSAARLERISRKHCSTVRRGKIGYAHRRATFCIPFSAQAELRSGFKIQKSRRSSCHQSSSAHESPAARQPHGRDDIIVPLHYCDRQPEGSLDEAVKGVSFVDGRNRSDVASGADVSIVLKEDQRTGKQTRGIVQDLLTNSTFHPHGIKVRLRDGKVGRVQVIHNAGQSTRA